ncbi:type II toxin-antitoxin system YafQ family toxin [Parabacteroides sp. Marseille-P3160]|uniref:type II toxin-antitoxin system YafQ family toxin n=1 Tax=Parabacteroides sp. Marseille-P3160 TaxID=1917887 RepID=UPI001F20489E|nr:type II toxin-antitoxin system YafQ family toxin [Parabacteroides sp. Marseille-P3160]
MHKLTGKYKECMECHIEADFSLIWLDEKTNIIGILRLGGVSDKLYQHIFIR